MPRMRTLKPEAATSETLCQVDRSIRWTFGLLWTYCDDEGRAVLNPRLIKAALYPLDDDVTAEVISYELSELRRIGALCVYEIGGKEHLHVPSWPEHQHPNRKLDSKLPACPKTEHTDTPHAQRSEEAVSEQEQGTPVVVVGDVEVDGVGEGAGANAGTPTAQTIVAEWMDHVSKRPPQQVIGQASKHIAAMLEEGIDPDDVRRGVAAWVDKGLHPAALPSVVNEVMNARRRASPSKRNTDDRVRDGLTIAARLAEPEQPQRRQLGA